MRHTNFALNVIAFPDKEDVPSFIAPDQAPDDWIPLDALALVAEMSDTLLAHGCLPVGTAAGRIRDPDWGGDLGEFVTRAEPHEVNDEGTMVTVSLKLNTLRCEIDDLHEVCAWTYTED